MLPPTSSADTTPTKVSPALSTQPTSSPSGMTVAVRIRPLMDTPAGNDCSTKSSTESRNDQSNLSVEGISHDRHLLKVTVGQTQGTVQSSSDQANTSSSTFRFDHVLWSTGTSRDASTALSDSASASGGTATQQEVYQALGAPLVRDALQGFHCTLFAYGQTGAGKTHTMIGDIPEGSSSGAQIGAEGEHGLIPRICSGLLATAAATVEEKLEGSSDTTRVTTAATATATTTATTTATSFSFSVTYVEIFLEKVRDLLLPSPSSAGSAGTPSASGALRVREHPTDGPFVEGATVATVTSEEDCWALLRRGENSRHTASTRMNQHSSRSHAIFSLVCTQTQTQRFRRPDTAGSGRGEDGGDTCEVTNTIVSKINLVDLAGSENASSSGSLGQASRLKEGAAINKSLLALGRVIQILAENTKAQFKVPSSLSTTPPSVSSKGGVKHNRRRTLGASSSRPATSDDGPRRHSRSPPPPSSNSRRSSLPGRSPNTGSTPPPSTSTRPAQVVPYRDSVLTYLLRESLGGSAKTTMIAAVRPGLEFADETMNTLKYAAQARQIVSEVVVNENPYMRMIRQLQQEVQILSERLLTPPPPPPKPLSPTPNSHPTGFDLTEELELELEGNEEDGIVFAEQQQSSSERDSVPPASEEREQGHEQEHEDESLMSSVLVEHSYYEDADSGPVSRKEGFLLKRGFVNKAFQRRWCVLTGEHIWYYKRYRDRQPRGSICCSGATVERHEPEESLPFGFWLRTPRDPDHRKWLLQAASEDEYLSWKAAIEEVAGDPPPGGEDGDGDRETCVVS